MNLIKPWKGIIGKNKRISLAIAGFFIFCFIHIPSYGQENQTIQDSLNFDNEVDIFQVLRKWMGKPPKQISNVPVRGVKNLSLLPIVGYSPANGFVIGGAVSVTEYHGDPKNTRLSSALLNVSLTTKKQVLLNLRYDYFTSENKWYLNGDNRLLFFAQPTYGLGIYGLHNQTYHFSINGGDVDRTDSAQPMRFNYIRLYETASKHIGGQWYAGMGIMFDINFNIKDQALSLDSPAYLTSNYVYSKSYGFDTSHYSANGLSFQVIHDSRDNPINAYKGSYLHVAFRVNPIAFGSTQSSTMLYYEWRNYIGLSKRIPRNLLAFWFWGVLTTSGHLPYLANPAITWDTYNRSGRGYIQGRFRGNNMIYEEAEFRYRISRNGLFGGVVFANFTTASNPISKQQVFDSVAPGYGFGLRIMMNKKDRTNIAVDYGIGDGFSGIYFNIREAF